MTKLPPLLKKSNIEYVDYSLNWMTGCANNCLYCPDGGWDHPIVRIPNPAAKLNAELSACRVMPTGTFLLSSSHDPAMDQDTVADLGQIIATLDRFQLDHQALLLTKNPTLALGALQSYRLIRFGATITSMGIAQTTEYEPHAEPPHQRLAALAAAARNKYPTWISLEPPLPNVYLHRLVQVVLEFMADARPWIVLGKMNYLTGPRSELREWSAADHWADDRDQAIAALHRAGYEESLPRDGGYWIKSELRRAQ